jgi:hypothetical protein
MPSLVGTFMGVELLSQADYTPSNVETNYIYLSQPRLHNSVPPDPLDARTYRLAPAPPPLHQPHPQSQATTLSLYYCDAQTTQHHGR